MGSRVCSLVHHLIHIHDLAMCCRLVMCTTPVSDGRGAVCTGCSYFFKSYIAVSLAHRGRRGEYQCVAQRSFECHIQLERTTRKSGTPLQDTHTYTSLTILLNAGINRDVAPYRTYGQLSGWNSESRKHHEGVATGHTTHLVR